MLRVNVLIIPLHYSLQSILKSRIGPETKLFFRPRNIQPSTWLSIGLSSVPTYFPGKPTSRAMACVRSLMLISMPKPILTGSDLS